MERTTHCGEEEDEDEDDEDEDTTTLDRAVRGKVALLAILMGKILVRFFSTMCVILPFYVCQIYIGHCERRKKRQNQPNM